MNAGSQGVVVRTATADDAAAAVARLYNAGIDGRQATFETDHRSTVAIADRIARTEHPHAWLVAARDGEVLGWAATSPYSTRPVYAGIAEYSVYVDPAHTGRGVGTVLLAALLRSAQSAGLHKVTSRIFPENTASLALARRSGFRVVGPHLAHAQLDGVWRDVVTVEALLLRPPAR